MPKIGTFGPKSFGESWATDTYTGRALDKIMGGRLSQQVKANQIKAGAVKRGPGASMAASKASATAKAKAAANSAVQGKSFMGPTGGFGKKATPGGVRTGVSGGMKFGGSSSSGMKLGGSGGMKSGPGATGGSKTGGSAKASASSPAKTGGAAKATGGTKAGGMKSGPGATGGTKTGASKGGALGTSRFARGGLARKKK